MITILIVENRLNCKPIWIINYHKQFYFGPHLENFLQTLETVINLNTTESIRMSSEPTRKKSRTRILASEMCPAPICTFSYLSILSSFLLRIFVLSLLLGHSPVTRTIWGTDVPRYTLASGPSSYSLAWLTYSQLLGHSLNIAHSWHSLQGSTPNPTEYNYRLSWYSDILCFIHMKHIFKL